MLLWTLDPRPADYIALTTQERPGERSTAKIASGAEELISHASKWIPRTRTASTSQTPPPIDRRMPARIFSRSRARRAATITIPSGSIPQNPDILFLGVDQGATISVNGGKTWSSWYNQPTAQFYHVITDNRFPYWVYGGQQESGSAAVASRSDDGAINFRSFRTVGVEEYGYVAPDPLNPDIIYGGKATRFNWVTGDVQDVSPQSVARQLPIRANHAAALLKSRSARSLSRFQRSVQNGQRRQ